MKNTQLKEFAKHVVLKGVTKDESKKVLSLLSVADLKTFKRMLQSELEKHTVYITSSDELDRDTSTQLNEVFKNKRIVRHVDSKIGGGINARVYDMIYDLSVKSSIERIAKQAQEEI